MTGLPVITSPSRCYLEETVSHYSLHPEIAEHIDNPVGLEKGTPLWRLEGCDHNTLLFVGRFDKIKGADLVIRAFQRLLEHKPELRLIFVGPDRGLVQADGSKLYLKDFVDSLGGGALERQLEYKGSLTPKEIVALRTQALCTIVASRRENQPYVALEAMSQGCPIVCSDNSGLSELIQHDVTGLKAKSDSVDDLAAQLQRIIDDPALGESLGAAAREQAMRKHSPELIADETVAVYRRAIDLHASASLALG